MATSFGLIRPSSGQYLQKLKNADAYNVNRQYHGISFTVIIVLYKGCVSESGDFENVMKSKCFHLFSFNNMNTMFI